MTSDDQLSGTENPLQQSGTVLFSLLRSSLQRALARGRIEMIARAGRYDPPPGKKRVYALRGRAFAR
jgi:hypothetical protein